MRLRHQLLVFFIVISISSFSQIASHVLFHSNTINAAYAGSDESFHIGVNYRFHVDGITGSPRTLLFNMHTPAYKGLGVGLSYTTDRISLYESNTTTLDFSYKYQIDENKQLSFGVKALYYLNSSALNHEYLGEDFNLDSDKSFNMGIGFFYKTDYFFAGLATINLFKTQSSIFPTLSYKPTFIANSGFLVAISENMILKPSVTFFMKDSYFYYMIASQLDIQTFETSLYYSYSDLLGVGIMSPKLLNALKIGFNYEYYLTNLSANSSSVYNFIAKFEIKDLKKLSKRKASIN